MYSKKKQRFNCFFPYPLNTKFYLELNDLAIFELGIMKNGILLINRTYYNKMNELTQIRRSQIIDAISQMVGIILNDSVKFMKIDEFVIGLFKTDIQTDSSLKSNISSYIIGDNHILKEQMFTLLKRITSVFRTSYPIEHLNYAINSNNFQSFGHEIDMILKDLQYTPLDRMRIGLL